VGQAQSLLNGTRWSARSIYDLFSIVLFIVHPKVELGFLLFNLHLFTLLRGILSVGLGVAKYKLICFFLSGGH
jgi:hypothetical protein